MYLAYENINPILCIAVEFPPRPPPGDLKLPEMKVSYEKQSNTFL